MVYREGIEIKTKYNTINECRGNCRDISSKIAFPMVGTKKIYGEIYKDNTFSLSSSNKIGSLFRFEGHIEARGDGIYMCGDISVKKYYKIFLYANSVFFIVLGFLIIIRGGLDIILFGIALIVIGWGYIFIMKSSNTLYNNLIHKLKK